MILFHSLDGGFEFNFAAIGHGATNGAIFQVVLIKFYIN